MRRCAASGIAQGGAVGAGQVAAESGGQGNVESPGARRRAGRVHHDVDIGRRAAVITDRRGSI